MLKVKNHGTLLLLTGRFLKMNRGRNLAAVAAIALTSLLFSSMFTGAYSLFLSKRTTECKESMAFEHAVVSDMTKKEYERALQAVENDRAVERFGEGIFLGTLDEEGLGFQTEVRYSDRNGADAFWCVPQEGRLPEKKQEIALSTLVLDALEIPRRLGEEIRLTIDVNLKTGEKRTDTFTLCGYWEGDPSLNAQMAWVSKEYVLGIVPNVDKRDLQNGFYQGGRELYVWFKNVWDLEQKVERLSKEAGFLPKQNETHFRVNPAYLLFEEDGFSLKNLLFLAGFVMLAGYLIIYNIFSISVDHDIRIYGLLKNIGTTGRQLKKIVFMQAFALSLAGIPIGLFLGALAGVKMTPYLMADINSDAKQVVVTSVNLWIFLAAAVFSLASVCVAVYPACWKVQRMSPVEALQSSGEGDGRKKEKPTGHISWAGMAVLHFRKNMGKNLIVMVSIALSLTAFNCVIMLVQGFHFDEFLSIYMDSDFQINKCGPTLSGEQSLHGVSPEVRDTIEKCPDIKSIGYVYYREEVHKLEPELEEFCQKKYRQAKKSGNTYAKEGWEQILSQGEIRLHFMGINRAVFDRLEWEKPCNWEDFADGSHVLLTDPAGYAFTKEEWYQTGQDFSMQYQSGTSKTYQVLGEALIPYSLDYPYADFGYMTVLVPEQEFMECTGEDGALLAAVNAGNGKKEQVSDYLKENVMAKDSALYLDSILDLEESFQKYADKYYLIGGTLAAVLAVIGMMNFFNTTAAQAIARKRELTLLEAVGMTGGQIQKMLVLEGVILLTGAAGFAALLVVFFAEKILANTVGLAFFTHLQTDARPCLALMPVLVATAWIVPLYHYRKMKRESLADRLRSQ